MDPLLDQDVDPRKLALARALGQAPEGTHYASLPGGPLLLGNDSDALTSGFGVGAIGRMLGIGGPPPAIPGPPAAGGQSLAPPAAQPAAPEASIARMVPNPAPPNAPTAAAQPATDPRLESAKEDYNFALAGLNAARTPELQGIYAKQLDAAKAKIEALIAPPAVRPMTTAEATQYGGLDASKYEMTAEGPKLIPTEKDDKTEKIKDFEYMQAHPEFATAARQFSPQPNHVLAPGQVLVDASGKTIATGPPNTASIDPETSKFLGQEVALGNISALTGWGRGRQGPENLGSIQKDAVAYAKANNIDPQGVLDNIAAFGGQKSGARTAATIGAKLDIFGESAKNAADYAIQKSWEVPRSSWVPINQIVMMGKRLTSNTPLAVLNAANEALANEYGRAINLATGAVTDTARDHAYAMLNLATSPETYEGVANGLKWEIDNVHTSSKGVAGKIRKGTGGEPPIPPLAIPRGTPPPSQGAATGAAMPAQGSMAGKSFRWVPGQGAIEK